MEKEIDEENPFIFKKGKMVHYYLLQPDIFDKNYVFLDYETPKSQQQKDFCDKVARYRSGNKEEILLRAYKECYSTKESDEKIVEKANSLKDQFKDYIKSIKLTSMQLVVISPSVNNKLIDIKSKICDHKIAKELIFNEQNSLFGNTEELFIENELEVYWEYNGVECKSAIDRLIIDHKNKVIKLIDLKTSSSFEEFKEKFDEYKYYRQVAFYWMAINYKYPELKDYNMETYVVAINMKEPTEIKVFEISELTLKKGYNEILPLINQLKWHYLNNLWEYPMDYYNGKGTELI
jgi:hypothetical protein